MESINIIGGGIGGLTLANACAKAGIDFSLYEQAPALTEIGAAIGISKASIDILNTFDLGDQIKSSGSITKHIQFADKNLNVIRAFSTETPGVIIHRAKLIDILASRVPAEKIKLNKKLIDLTCKPDFSELSFSDGYTLTSRFTVMADGINSVGRKKIFPEIKLRHAGHLVWRGITSLELPEKYSNTFVEIWDHTKRFLFAPINNNSVCWLAIKNFHLHEKENTESIRQDLLNEYKSFHPLVQELIFRSTNFIRNEIQDLGDQKRSWYTNTVVFLGDAIHATTPNMAQGGCQAMEDAYCLSLLMQNKQLKLQQVFSRYQQLRNRKVDFIVKNSWRVGKIAHNRWLAGGGKILFRFAPIDFFKSQEGKLNDLSYLIGIAG